MEDRRMVMTSPCLCAPGLLSLQKKRGRWAVGPLNGRPHHWPDVFTMHQWRHRRDDFFELRRPYDDQSPCARGRSTKTPQDFSWAKSRGQTNVDTPAPMS